jgi:hypothetical protein
MCKQNSSRSKPCNHNQYYGRESLFQLTCSIP